ncbi:D(3) dopamine receptor [Eurytemora carolleeae]|uniref:D(3) dopamine receptor n=1 Tax=Eurytemora carolleeae TaxID=1294199 RepID=UPI000C77F55F|nr:D(3) dopamine receptor [Eurytemora carolleeae]|eukprot:XP_023332594.1 D(3) dopamine receptor-like [Eurytemora affinis]
MTMLLRGGEVSTNEQDAEPSQSLRVPCTDQGGRLSTISVNPRMLSAALARERRLVIVMVLVVGCFIMCYLPFWASILTVLYCSRCPAPHPHILTAFQWLAYSNSVVNPVIYTLFNPEYRSAATIILSRIRNI